MPEGDTCCSSNRMCACPSAKAGDARITALLDGSYQPQPVRGVEIHKPGGGKRQLGIPTVVDRLVQQAILSRASRPDAVPWRVSHN